MKLVLSYLIGMILITITIGFVKDPIIAFVSFMAINTITAIITAIASILSGSAHNRL